MRIINSAPIRPIESIKPIKPVKEVNRFIDFDYKLERNEFNKLLFLESQKLKMIENSLGLQNNKYLSSKKISSDDKVNISTKFNNVHPNIDNNKDKLAYDRIAAYSKLMRDADTRKLMHEFNDKNMYHKIVSTLNKCHKDLVDFASMTLLINASYLISPTAVLALINSKDEDI